MYIMEFFRRAKIGMALGVGYLIGKSLEEMYPGHQYMFVVGFAVGVISCQWLLGRLGKRVDKP
jgi:uncharacterized transporter YbjL